MRIDSVSGAGRAHRELCSIVLSRPCLPCSDTPPVGTNGLFGVAGALPDAVYRINSHLESMQAGSIEEHCIDEPMIKHAVAFPASGAKCALFEQEQDWLEVFSGRYRRRDFLGQGCAKHECNRRLRDVSQTLVHARQGWGCRWGKTRPARQLEATGDSVPACRTRSPGCAVAVSA